MSSESKPSRPGGLALALVLLLALAAVALLVSGPDDAGGGRVAVVTSGSSSAVPDPALVTRIDPHGEAAPGRTLDAGPGGVGEVARVPDDDGATGPHAAGEVIDGRPAAPASDDPVVRATGLAGRFVARGGAPVAGAQVTARGARPGAGGMTVMTLKPGPDGELEMTSPGEVRVSATTDEDGRFTLTGLDAALRFTLHVRPRGDDPDLLSARQPAPALRRGQVVDAGEVRLPRAARLSGVVRDPAGRPVPEATVRLGGDGPLEIGDGAAGEGKATFTVRRAVRVAAPAAGGAGPDGPGLDLTGGLSTRTDAAGRFALARVRPGKHTVTATKEGLRAARTDVELAEGQQKDDLDLRLADGLAVSVQVVDAQGQPIAGATVQVSAGFGGFGPGGGGGQAQTDAQGLARVDGLSSSEVTIAAQAEGFASTALEARLGAGDPDSPRRVALRRGATVTGRLVRASDGAGVAGAFVFLEPLVHGPGVDVSVDGSNRTDEAGRFTLRGVAPGRYRLNARAPGLAPGSAEVTVTAGAPTVAVADVRLGDLAGLDVLVLDPDGAPVADAAVDAGPNLGGGVMMIALASGEGGPPLPMGGARGRTGPDGKARLDGLQPGALAVRGAKPPFADGQASVSVEAGARAEVTVRLARPARVEGHVLGAEPGARSTVLLHAKDRGGPPSRVEAGDDGAFAFERVAPGEYALSVEGPPEAGAWFAVAEGETVTRTVEVAPTATIEGTVTRADGLPAAGASLALGWLDTLHMGEVGFVQARATSDAAGHYAFSGVRPGPSLGVTVTTTAGAKASFRVDVPGPAPVRRDLRLPAPDAGAPVTLRVVDEQGAPLVGARVTLERADDGPVARFEQTTGPDGAARFDAVPAGRFAAAATAPGCARSRATLDVTAGPLEGPTLRLGPGGALLVEVLGAGEGEARLTLRREGSTDPMDTWFTTVALGGRARFDGLEVGARYEVQASAGGHDEGRLTVACDGADPQAPATLRLRPRP